MICRPSGGPGFTPYEQATKYPLQVEGELRGAQLMLVGSPRERDLKFRVGILFPAMICRLDYTDETHVNSSEGFLRDRVPKSVTGPHYHSWQLNRAPFPQHEGAKAFGCGALQRTGAIV